MIRIKELREARKLNQQGLAAELNVSQAMISKYELGISEPDISTIRKIAEFFGVSSDYLLEITDEKFIASPFGLSNDEKEVLFGFKRLNSIQKERAFTAIIEVLKILPFFRQKDLP